MRKDCDNSIGLHFKRTGQVFYFCDIFLPKSFIKLHVFLHNFYLLLSLKENSEMFKIIITLTIISRVNFNFFLTLFRKCRKSEGFTILELLSIVQRESSKRNFNFHLIFESIMKSLNPIDIVYSWITLLWYIAITSVLKMPLLLVRELQALKSRHKHYYPDTLTYTLFCYVPLTFQALREIASISWIAVTAPKIIIEELFLKHSQSNQLQTISSCGRKVVAWSEEVNIELVRQIADITGATETEILLASTVDTLKEYFKHSNFDMPDDVFATVKFVSQRAVFLRNHEAKGILCLALPIKTPFFHDDFIEMLQVRIR